MKRFLSLVLAMLIAITMLIIPASAENYATAVVKGGWLRLRAEASASSETISAYFTGTQVTIIGTSGEWYYVLTPDGHYGFMNSNALYPPLAAVVAVAPNSGAFGKTGNLPGLPRPPLLGEVAKPIGFDGEV